MFARACKTVLMMGMVGCLPAETSTFDALTSNWSNTTLETAEPAVRAALLVSGLTAELCRFHITPDYWQQTQAGDSLPLSSELDTALGNPYVDSISVEGSTQVTLAGVQIIDRDNAFLRFTVASEVDAYSLNVDVLDGRNDVPFGQLRMAISESCEGALQNSVWVSGEAQWTDLSGLTHNITLPADANLSVGLNVDCGFIPNAGTLSWQGSIDGQVRNIVTNDAADIVFEDDTDPTDAAASDTGPDSEHCARIAGQQQALWPSIVRGDNGRWEVSEDLQVRIRTP